MSKGLLQAKLARLGLDVHSLTGGDVHRGSEGGHGRDFAVLAIGRPVETPRECGPGEGGPAPADASSTSASQKAALAEMAIDELEETFHATIRAMRSIRNGRAPTRVVVSDRLDRLRRGAAVIQAVAHARGLVLSMPSLDGRGEADPAKAVSGGGATRGRPRSPIVMARKSLTAALRGGYAAHRQASARVEEDVRANGAEHVLSILEKDPGRFGKVRNPRRLCPDGTPDDNIVAAVDAMASALAATKKTK